MSSSLEWRTSSYTGTETCVEVADNDPAVVRVRDSKNLQKGQINVRPATWAEFVKSCKDY
jgi:hypothetical protein